MTNILTDEKISENLVACIAALGMSNAKFSKEIKKSLANVNEYTENKWRAIHLVPSLVHLGVNANWFLTGEGEMFMDKHKKSTPETHETPTAYNLNALDYTKIGKMLVDVVAVAIKATTGTQ